MGTNATAMERQRGFTLLETMVIAAVLSFVLLGMATTLGMRIPRAHPAELALQAALIEARTVAANTGNVTDPVVPTGATVTVDRDRRDRTGFSSIIKVYRSRPIPYAGPAARAATAPNRLNQDTGFPTVRVGATFFVTDTNPPAGNGSPGPPFTILISHSGYASILRGYLYDPVANNYFGGADPGCTDGGVTIGADDGMRRESAAFSCREGVLQMTSTAYAS